MPEEKYISLAECKIPSKTLIKCSYCPTGLGDYLVVVGNKVIF